MRKILTLALNFISKQIGLPDSRLTYLDCQTDTRSRDTATPPLSRTQHLTTLTSNRNFSTDATAQLFDTFYPPPVPVVYVTTYAFDHLRLLPSTLRGQKGSVMWHKCSFCLPLLTKRTTNLNHVWTLTSLCTYYL